VGKWHLGNKDEYFPMNHGFDSWFGLLIQMTWIMYQT